MSINTENYIIKLPDTFWVEIDYNELLLVGVVFFDGVDTGVRYNGRNLGDKLFRFDVAGEKKFEKSVLYNPNNPHGLRVEYWDMTIPQLIEYTEYDNILTNFFPAHASVTINTGYRLMGIDKVGFNIESGIEYGTKFVLLYRFYEANGMRQVKITDKNDPLAIRIAIVNSVPYTPTFHKYLEFDYLFRYAFVSEEEAQEKIQIVNTNDWVRRSIISI